MFEATIIPAAADASAPGTLRPLAWGEIVARLSAARDLRAVFARPPIPASSFADQATRGLASEGYGERAVNHDTLGRGKTHAAISAATVREAAASDQGTR